MELGNLAPDVLIGQPEVDAGSVDVAVTQLLLKGIQAATAIQEVNSIAMPEQVGVDIALQISPLSRSFDYLVCPLLGDVASLPGREQIIMPVQTLANPAHTTDVLLLIARRAW